LCGSRKYSYTGDSKGWGTKANIFIGKKLNWKIQRVRKGFKPPKKKPTTVGKVWIFCGITHCYRGSLHKKSFLESSCPTLLKNNDN